MFDPVISKAELELIIKHLSPVKQAGFGELLIQVQNGCIVNIKQSTTYNIPKEQMKMKLNGQ